MEPSEFLSQVKNLTEDLNECLAEAKQLDHHITLRIDTNVLAGTDKVYDSRTVIRFDYISQSASWPSQRGWCRPPPAARKSMPHRRRQAQQWRLPSEGLSGQGDPLTRPSTHRTVGGAHL